MQYSPEQQSLTKELLFKSDLHSQQKELYHFQKLLLDEFNNGQPFQNEKEMNKVFCEVEIIKYQTETVGGCSIVMALTGNKFPSQMMQTEKRKKLKGIQKDKMKFLEVVLDNFQFNESNNPISVIKENCHYLKLNHLIAEETVFNYKNRQTTNQLLYHVLIEPTQNKNEWIKRLSIRKVEIKANDKKVVQLKKIEVQHLIGRSKRYCYCYLYPRDPQNEINNFCVVLVQSFVEAKEGETKSDNNFEKEGYINLDNNKESDYENESNKDDEEEQYKEQHTNDSFTSNQNNPKHENYQTKTEEANIPNNVLIQELKQQINETNVAIKYLEKPSTIKKEKVPNHTHQITDEQCATIISLLIVLCLIMVFGENVTPWFKKFICFKE